MYAMVVLALLGADPVELKGKVVRIVDGDTIVVLVGKEQTKIRLEGIDSPESKQPFGTKAKEHLGNLCHEKEATIRVTGKDRYGRSLGIIFVGKLNVNQEMVASGNAWHFKKYSKDKELSRLEEQARMNKCGLWGGSETPIPPWEWRDQKKVKAE